MDYEIVVTLGPASQSEETVAARADADREGLRTWTRSGGAERDEPGLTGSRPIRMGVGPSSLTFSPGFWRSCPNFLTFDPMGCSGLRPEQHL